jgi:transposase
MWDEITRRQYRRDGLRYASDTTDDEWALIEPLMPAARERGRPRTTELRAVVNAIFYIAQTGCPLRQKLWGRRRGYSTIVVARSDGVPHGPIRRSEPLPRRL